MADKDHTEVKAREAALTYPAEVEQVDKAWLDAAIGVNFPDTKILSIKQSRIIWGTATKVFFDLQYQDSADKLPPKICVKGCFDERIRAYLNLDALFVTEAAFYRDLAPRLDILLPQVVLGAENGKDGVVVLEDLGGRVTFGDPTKAWTPDETLPILDSLARLHGMTWGWKGGALPWLTLGSVSQHDGLTAMMAEDRFETLIARPEVSAFVPAGYRDRDQVMAGLRAMWRRDDASAHLCVCHGDAHIGQTYIDEENRRGLLDWQSVAIMPWAKDIGYFLSGALSVADRRAHERDLLEYYLKSLEANGGAKLNRDEALNEYAIQTLCGIVWPIVTEQQQAIDNVIAMSERHCAALADLQPLARLGL